MMSSSSTIDALPDEVLYLVHTTSIDPKTVEELRPSEMSAYQYPIYVFNLNIHNYKIQVKLTRASVKNMI